MKTRAQEIADELNALNACSDAIEWVTGKSLQRAWKICNRADWMLWYATHKIDRKKLVHMAAMCAETVLHIYEQRYPDDKRPRECIQACYDYADGKITLDELQKYRKAADAAGAAADAAGAARAAAYAAGAAAGAVRAAAYAAGAALAAAYAAGAAAATRKKQHKLMCNIIRRKIKLEELTLGKVYKIR